MEDNIGSANHSFERKQTNNNKDNGKKKVRLCRDSNRLSGIVRLSVERT